VLFGDITLRAISVQNAYEVVTLNEITGEIIWIKQVKEKN
jgi:hypothetical protein